MAKTQWIGNVLMRGDEALGRIEFDEIAGWIGFCNGRIVGTWDHAADARHAVRNEVDPATTNAA